jgi:hypothetical protein
MANRMERLGVTRGTRRGEVIIFELCSRQMATASDHAALCVDGGRINMADRMERFEEMRGTRREELLFNGS